MQSRRIVSLIGGPRTFSWQAAAWVIIISIAIGFRMNYQPGVTDPVLLFTVMAGIASITVSVFAILAAGYSLLANVNLRFGYAIVGFLVVILVRAKVADVLLMEWGIAHESKLDWRIKQVTIFGIVSLVTIAIVMNLIDEKKQRLSSLRDELQREINRFHSVLTDLSQQRIYTIHEMSVESSTAQELIGEISDVLPVDHEARSALTPLELNVNYISEILSRARQITPLDIDDKVDAPESSWVQENLLFMHSYEDKLTSAIVEVTKTREQLESMYQFENRMWKQAFISDISNSPTAGTILLRQVLENTKAATVTDSITRVAAIWNSIAQIATSSAANSTRLATSGRLEP